MSTPIPSPPDAPCDVTEAFSDSDTRPELLALRALRKRRETALEYVPFHKELAELLQDSRDSLPDADRQSLELVLSNMNYRLEAVRLLQDATVTMDDTRAWCPDRNAYQTFKTAGDARASHYERIVQESIETYRLYQEFVEKDGQAAASRVTPTIPQCVVEAMSGRSQLVQTPSIREYTENRWKEMVTERAAVLGQWLNYGSSLSWCQSYPL